jgi:hypothetical protein
LATTTGSVGWDAEDVIRFKPTLMDATFFSEMSKALVFFDVFVTTVWRMHHGAAYRHWKEVGNFQATMQDSHLAKERPYRAMPNLFLYHRKVFFSHVFFQDNRALN